MGAYKDEKGKTWYVSFTYEDHSGVRKEKVKRGFETKREALEWERKFLEKDAGSIEMLFGDFVDVYYEFIKPRIKHSTWLTKTSMINLKIKPYFEYKPLLSLSPRDISAWQTKMLMEIDPRSGKPYSPVYLRSLNSQLSTIFNHAVRYYNLPENPMVKAGTMGKKKAGETDFWTHDEFMAFLDSVTDKEMSYFAFQILYWCGIREGELLALTVSDINIRKKTLRVNKTYSRHKGVDYITTPKTEKSNRTISIPDFLNEELADYLKNWHKAPLNSRIFPVTKSYLHAEMTRGSRASGVQRVKIHALRHSAVSLLIELKYSVVSIANRMGHESIDITLNYAHLFPNHQEQMANGLDEYHKR